MRIDIKGELSMPPYEIDARRDVFITNHHAYVRDDGVAIPTTHGAQVEVAFGAVHVWMSEEEANAFGKNLQTLSSRDKIVDALGLARHHVETSSMAPNPMAFLAAALTEVIAYLEAQRSTEAAKLAEATSPFDAIGTGGPW
jgi:hypothetical protein